MRSFGFRVAGVPRKWPSRRLTNRVLDMRHATLIPYLGRRLSGGAGAMERISEVVRRHFIAKSIIHSSLRHRLCISIYGADTARIRRDSPLGTFDLVN